jgi:hypothetical protein
MFALCFIKKLDLAELTCINEKSSVYLAYCCVYSGVRRRGGGGEGGREVREKYPLNVYKKVLNQLHHDSRILN